MSLPISPSDVPDRSAIGTSEERKSGFPEERLDPGKTGRELPPAARRALQEAAERRAARDAEAAKAPAAREAGGGPAGPNPVRYGDWEVKGKATDF